MQSKLRQNNSYCKYLYKISKTTQDMNKNTFYVTTPIYYPSGNPHLGHAYCSISCDVLARWNRDIGKQVFFQSGTDEHGQKIKESAIKKGVSPKEFVDEISKQFRKITPEFNLSEDYFLRTTDENHKELVQKMIQKAFDNGDIYKDEYEGLYCVGCERYYGEDELVENTTCPIHKTKCEIVKEENYFFKLSKYENKLIELYEKNENFISPKNKKQEILNRVKEGLRDISISRQKDKLDWGIEIPFDKSHVIYVWFDALFNYYTSTQFLDKKEFWPADVHVVGHDIMWFHCVYWPAFLMSVNEELPNKIFAHGMILDEEGHKMSKSLGNVVDPFVEKKRFGLDEFRFYLLSSGTFGDDLNYSREKLIEKINNDLNNDLGNLVSRVHAMTGKYFEGKVPEMKKLTREDEEFIEKLDIFDKFNSEMEELKFNSAIETLWGAIRETNAYVNQQSPWKIEDKERLSTVINILNSSVILFGKYINCIMPEKSNRIFKQYNMINDHVFKLKFITENHLLGEKDNIFEKIKIEKEVEKKVEDVKTGFSSLNLKVGKIVEIVDHPEAEKLYIERIDVGEDKTRQIISGLKDYYTKEEMLNKKVIVVANLKPAKLRGTLSEGMLLAAEDKDKNVGLISTDAQIGTHLKCGEDIANNSKQITIDGFFKVKMKSDGSKVMYKENEVKVSNKTLLIDKGVAGSIR